jgi:hypothetical protein
MASWSEVEAEVPELARHSAVRGEQHRHSHRFRADVEELSAVRAVGDLLVIDAWHAGRGVSRRERR